MAHYYNYMYTVTVVGVNKEAKTSLPMYMSAEMHHSTRSLDSDSSFELIFDLTFEL